MNIHNSFTVQYQMEINKQFEKFKNRFNEIFKILKTKSVIKDDEIR